MTQTRTETDLNAETTLSNLWTNLQEWALHTNTTCDQALSTLTQERVWRGLPLSGIERLSTAAARAQVAQQVQAILGREKDKGAGIEAVTRDATAELLLLAPFGHSVATRTGLTDLDANHAWREVYAICVSQG